MSTNLSPFAVTIGKDTSTNTEYHFNLMSEVEGPEKYTDLLNTLRTATSGDTINIHINSFGGQIRTAVQIMNSILLSDAKVVGHLEAECHSAATLIFLACDTWVVHNNIIALFHQYTSGTYGEGHKIRASVKATDKWIEGINNTYYKNFLSDDELTRMNNGEDFYFTSEEILDRLENYSKAREEALSRKEQEQQQDLLLQAKTIIENSENDSRDNSEIKECAC